MTVQELMTILLDAFVLVYVLQAGAAPDLVSIASDRSKVTPLLTAIDRGYTEVARLLLAHGANPNKKISQCHTPLGQ